MPSQAQLRASLAPSARRPWVPISAEIFPEISYSPGSPKVEGSVQTLPGLTLLTQSGRFYGTDGRLAQLLNDCRVTLFRAENRLSTWPTMPITWDRSGGTGESFALPWTIGDNLQKKSGGSASTRLRETGRPFPSSRPSVPRIPTTQRHLPKKALFGWLKAPRKALPRRESTLSTGPGSPVAWHPYARLDRPRRKFWEEARSRERSRVEGRER